MSAPFTSPPAIRLYAYLFLLALLYSPAGGSDALYYLGRLGWLDSGNLHFLLVRVLCYAAMIGLFFLKLDGTRCRVLGTTACFALSQEILPLSAVRFWADLAGGFFAAWGKLAALLPMSLFLTPIPAIIHMIMLIALLILVVRYRSAAEDSCESGCGSVGVPGA